MIKAVFFDVDGTLVSFDTHTIPTSTLTSIAQLRAKGIKVFVATGRHRAALAHLDRIEFDGYITINGGYCTVEGDERLLHKQFISPKEVISLIEYQQATSSFPTMVVHEDGFFINYKDTQVDQVLTMLDFPNVSVAPLSKALECNVLQFVSFFTQEEEARIMKYMPDSEVTRWYPTFADIVPKGSNKSIGVEKVLAHYGIKKEECVAFGDGGNDVEMLTYVGVGIAMGNAHEKVKAMANYVTTTVDDNGIENGLKHYGLL